MTFRNSQQAFNDAILLGVLSITPASPNYAGSFMYMHTDAKGDAFKNIDTRRYLTVPADRLASLATFLADGEVKS